MRPRQATAVVRPECCGAPTRRRLRRGSPTRASPNSVGRTPRRAARTALARTPDSRQFEGEDFDQAHHAGPCRREGAVALGRAAHRERRQDDDGAAVPPSIMASRRGARDDPCRDEVGVDAAVPRRLVDVEQPSRRQPRPRTAGEVTAHVEPTELGRSSRSRPVAPRRRRSDRARTSWPVDPVVESRSPPRRARPVRPVAVRARSLYEAGWSTHTTSAPSRANLSAVARPMPGGRAAPVTKATRSSSRHGSHHRLSAAHVHGFTRDVVGVVGEKEGYGGRDLLGLFEPS